MNENKEIIYSNLKTNSKGEIILENFLPGTYYIQETNAKEGYIFDEKLIKFDIKFNEKLTITIDNLFEKKEVPKPEITENEMTETVIKRLPITGM